MLVCHDASTSLRVVPALQIEWCPECKGAVKFAMMGDNEGST
jgi:hypothetical protein